MHAQNLVGADSQIVILWKKTAKRKCRQVGFYPIYEFSSCGAIIIKKKKITVQSIKISSMNPMSHYLLVA